MASVMACGPLVGASIVNAEARQVGTLAHVMLDLALGRIAYAVVAHGGVLGLGEKLFAVPWDALSFDAARECFVLDSPRERLVAAKRLDPATLP